MTPLGIQNRRLKFLEMCACFYGNDFRIISLQEENVLMFRVTPQNREYASVDMHWFEFCFRFLSSKIAKHYSEHHLSATESFTKLMVLQKMAHDVQTSHPVDVLYDIWKNPKNYAETL